MINFKRISAIATSLLMVGMTAGVAAAATYPLPFVENNVANVAIVYGADSPNSLDLVPATSIQTDLATYITATAGTTGSTVTGGDNILIAKSSDNINIGNMWSVFTGSIDYSDMPVLLGKGTYIADDNDEFAYEQKIELGAPNLTHFRDSDYESQAGLTERTPVIGFKIASSTFIMNYTLDFTSDAESDVATAEMEDFEGSDLPLFGKTYYVSDFKNGTTSTDFFGKVTLLDAAGKGTVSEGETASVTVGGKTYKVGLNFIGSSTVKFDVDGALTNTLSAGETFKLKDDSYIGVREINTQDYAGGIKTVEFSIGTGKLEITSGSDVKLNDVAVQGVKGFVYEGTGSSGSEKIDKIVLDWTTDEEIFLTPGLELTMPGFKAVKFTMGDFVRPTEEKVIVEKDSDTVIELTVPIKDGTVSIPILYANSSGEFSGIGKSSTERLATAYNTTQDGLTYYEKESGNDYHKWFVATYNVSAEAESYVLRAKIKYDSTDNRNETTIEKYDGSTWTEVCIDRTEGQTCNIGQVTLTLKGIWYVSGGNESVNISGGTNVNFNSIYTKGGLRIYLPWLVSNATTGRRIGAINTSNLTNSLHGAVMAADRTEAGRSVADYYLYFDGEDKDDTIAGGTEFYLTIDDTSSGALQVSQVQGAGSGSALGLEKGDSTGIYEAYIVDDVAPRILHYTKPDEDYVEIYYPTGDSESYGQVYIADQSAVVSSTGATAKLGEVIIKDSEVSTMSSKNLIVVGGSCVNDVAANLVGGAKCTTAWETATGVGAGKYLIQSYTSPYATGKVAVLVAGYEAADTVNAQKALTTNKPDVTVGKKYTGTSATDMKAA